MPDPAVHLAISMRCGSSHVHSYLRLLHGPLRREYSSMRLHAFMNFHAHLMCGILHNCGRLMIMGESCAAGEHSSMELQARHLRQVGCRSLVHDGERRAIGPAQALNHAVDARDVVVAGAHKLEQALHWILPQDPSTFRQNHPACAHFIDA